MENQVKDKIMSIVRDAVKGRMENVELKWPEHSIRFYGHVPAGSGKIEVIDIAGELSYTRIRIKTPNGPRYFGVKVAEEF